MMHILFTILKVLGILVLILLCLAVIIICLVLLFPSAIAHRESTTTPRGMKMCFPTGLRRGPQGRPG